MAEPAWNEITQRELQNDSGSIMRAVERGKSFVITRNGTAVARLIPLRQRTFVPREEVLAAFASAPPLDPKQFGKDLDEAIDEDIPSREW